MGDEKNLEEVWDESYPPGDGIRLWPVDAVPMVGLAQAVFTEGAPILDLPCGDGKNVLALADIGPVVAADSSERALRVCEERKKQWNRSRIVTMNVNVFETPFFDATFENVFCCDLLGHLPNPEAALKELRRIISPAGCIVATFFSEQDSVLSDPRMSRNEDGSYWFQDKWFFRFYSESGVHDLCTRSGLHVSSIQEFSWWEGPHPGYREYDHQHTSWTAVLRRV